jgi:polyribonucleotide nucleotidyltransferase
VNPTFEQLAKADMDIMVGATYDNIMMVEGEMNECSEAELLEAMKVAHESIKFNVKPKWNLLKK